MKKFALTGTHIQHSKSPALFVAAYAEHPEFSYELLPAATAEEAMQLFCKKELQGMNVTAPFKNDILHFVDRQSDEVSAIGAANTIIRKGEKTMACNTDIAGVLDTFTQKNIPIKNEKAVVIGAGGAGRAAVYALKQGGAEVFWANRSFRKVENLAAGFGVQAIPTTYLDRQLQECRIVVNTLPEGCDCYAEFRIYKHNVVLDADYGTHPLYDKTIFSNGTYLNGRYWLLHQAIPAYILFTGIPPDIEKMKRVLQMQ